MLFDHIWRQDASHGGGCSNTSAYTGQFGWASMIWSIVSVATLRCREGGATLLSTGSHKTAMGQHCSAEYQHLFQLQLFEQIWIRILAKKPTIRQMPVTSHHYAAGLVMLMKSSDRRIKKVSQLEKVTFLMTSIHHTWHLYAYCALIVWSRHSIQPNKKG